MRHPGILRILSLAVVLALFLSIAGSPSPALAEKVLTITPTSGKVGDTVSVSGTGFNKSAADGSNDKYAALFFSSESATTLQDIDTNVTRYQKVRDAIWLDENGDFTNQTFVVPARLETGTNKVDVTSGTYYLYICQYMTSVPPTLSYRIAAIATFTIVSGAITANLVRGPAGAEVAISGTQFTASQTITFTYDGNAITPSSGSTTTSTTGSFASNIVIPESPAGTHSISATVATYTVSLQFTVDPDITLSPASGKAGTSVSIKGTGFGGLRDVSIYFKDSGVATAKTDSKGSFTATFNVPDMAATIYNIRAEDNSSTPHVDTAPFTVVATPAPPPTTPPPTTPPPTTPPPATATVSLNLDKGHVGTDLVVAGTGFKTGQVTVKYDTQTVATVTANGGVFVAGFKVPPSKYGSHAIVASDGTNTKELTFTMESEAPKIPTPQLPEMGTKIKSPAKFDWSDVTDDSIPVKYAFQIAASADFASAAIILEKKDLAQSEYALTEDEEQKLAAKNIPYYWRVRAVDAATNESGWTGGGMFYVNQPFKLPGWGLYVLFGLGGVLLFILGYWLGRRSSWAY